MPWITVVEPVAAPPRRPGPLTPPDPEQAIVELDGAQATISGAELRGPIRAPDGARLEIEASVLRGVSIEGPSDIELEIRSSVLEECDLSARRVPVLRSSQLLGCKLSGTDLGGAAVTDVALDGCLLRLTSFRMANLERVAFRGCTLDGVDLYDAELGDVDLTDAVLRDLEADQARFRAVDLRGAQEIGFRSVSRLVGCVIEPDQVVGMAFALAEAAGVAIARPTDDAAGGRAAPGIIQD